MLYSQTPTAELKAKDTLDFSVHDITPLKKHANNVLEEVHVASRKWKTNSTPTLSETSKRCSIYVYTCHRAADIGS
jgi:hypothetical protein